MKNQLVLHVVAKLLIPYILLYALYVQLHGEISPGGGFQAGVIFSSAFILYALVFGFSKVTAVLKPGVLKTLAALGVLLYGLVGVVGILAGKNFLNYAALNAGSMTASQQWGIMVIELGVGVTVFSVMLLLFYLFTERKDK